MSRRDRFNRFARNIDQKTIEENKSILIVCEGQQTEPLYFEAFEVYSASVKVIGTGKNTESLVNEAMKYIGEYDEVWCVFDKDSFKSQQFNNACKKAEEKGMRVAYSNESFELWYLLHFQFLESKIDRKTCIEKLNRTFKEKFGETYRKNDRFNFERLKPLQNTAVKHAKRLAKNYSSHETPAQRFPVTYVYELVEELSKLSRENRW